MNAHSSTLLPLVPERVLPVRVAGETIAAYRFSAPPSPKSESVPESVPSPIKQTRVDLSQAISDIVPDGTSNRILERGNRPTFLGVHLQPLLLPGFPNGWEDNHGSR